MASNNLDQLLEDILLNRAKAVLTSSNSENLNAFAEAYENLHFLLASYESPKIGLIYPVVQGIRAKIRPLLEKAHAEILEEQLQDQISLKKEE